MQFKILDIVWNFDSSFENLGKIKNRPRKESCERRLKECYFFSKIARNFSADSARKMRSF